MPQLLIARMTSASPNAMNLSASCRTIGHSSNHTRKTSLVCPRPRPRAATRRRSPTRARPARKPRRSGRFRRLGRAMGSGRASAHQPLRPRDCFGVCLRHGLRSARFAVCLRQRAQPAAYAHPRPVARQPFGAAGPHVTLPQRLQRPALWGIRVCVIRVARVATCRPWAAGGGRPVASGESVTARHQMQYPSTQRPQDHRTCTCRHPRVLQTPPNPPLPARAPGGARIPNAIPVSICAANAISTVKRPPRVVSFT